MDDIRPEGADKAQQLQLSVGKPGQVPELAADAELDDLDIYAAGSQAVGEGAAAWQHRTHLVSAAGQPDHLIMAPSASDGSAGHLQHAERPITVRG